MKNHSEIAGLGLLSKVSLFITQNSYLLLSIAAVAVGICFSMGTILGVASAFGVALAAGVPRKYCLQSSLGAVIGYLLLPAGSGSLQAGAVALVAAARFLVSGSKLEKRMITSGPVLAAIVMTATGLVAFKGPVHFYDATIFLAQAALAPACAFFIEKAVSDTGSITSEALERVSMVITVGIGLVGLLPIKIAGLYLGNIVGLTGILVASFCTGAGAGTVAGAVMGLVTGFVTGDFLTGIAAFSLIGLMSGVFAGAGRAACASAMIATGGFLLLTGVYTGLVPALEIAAASVVFMLLPAKLLRMVAKQFTTKKLSSSAIKTAMDIQLDDTINALKDICTTTKQVSNMLENLSAGSTKDIYDEVGEKLCRKCSKRMTCWGSAYSMTVDAVSAGIAAARLGGQVSSGDFPKEFLARCEQPSAFAKIVEDSYSHQVTRTAMKHKISSMRMAVTDQFEGMSMYLSGIRQRLDSITSADAALSLKVEELFTANRLEPVKAICHKNEDDRVVVTALLPVYKMGRAQSKTIVSELSGLLKRNMELAGKKEWGDGVYVIFREKTVFSTVFAGYQISSSGHTLCGDTYRQFHTEEGRAHMVISDGMGSGGSAAVDSAMAASLTERLVDSGADYYSTLRLVNSALLVKSGEESLATLDAARIDLYSGRVDFYKAGAAPSIIRHNGRAASVESASMPAGILSGVNFEHSTLRLKDGDLVLMFSDGVSATGVDWIISEVLTFSGDDINELCRKIAETARLRRTDGREDDITVVCACIKENLL